MDFVDLFVSALQLYQEGQFPAPDPTVTLCFGEELHDISNAKSKLIIVQVGQVKRNVHMFLNLEIGVLIHFQTQKGANE